MITRIARGDVVRITKTGEVGTVSGIADHDDVAKNGTLIDVKVSTAKSVTANGRELEFVANAKIENKRAAVVFVIVLTLVATSMYGYVLASSGVEIWFSVLTSLILCPALDRIYSAMFLHPRKTTVSLPKQVANPRRVTR